MKCHNPTVEIADGEYALAKAEAAKLGHVTRVNIRMIERRFKLRPGQLASYRANHYSRT